MEFGVYTLADIGQNPVNGYMPTVKERLDEVMQYGQLADEAGLHVFGVGEHHRLDYAVSAVPVVLSALRRARGKRSGFLRIRKLILRWVSRLSAWHSKYEFHPYNILLNSQVKIH